MTRTAAVLVFLCRVFTKVTRAPSPVLPVEPKLSILAIPIHQETAGNNNTGGYRDPEFGPLQAAEPEDRRQGQPGNEAGSRPVMDHQCQQDQDRDREQKSQRAGRQQASAGAGQPHASAELCEDRPAVTDHHKCRRERRYPGIGGIFQRQPDGCEALGNIQQENKDTGANPACRIVFVVVA